MTTRADRLCRCAGARRRLPRAPQAQISDDVVKIGVLTDMSGPVLRHRRPRLGRRRADGDRRLRRQGAAGKTIELVSADHQNKPDIGCRARRASGSTPSGVDMIIDGSTPASASRWPRSPRRRSSVLIATGAGFARAHQRGLHAVHRSTTPTTPTRSPTAPASAVVKQGGKTWFFLTADYAFGTSLENDTTDGRRRRTAARCSASVRHPLTATDFSSFLLQAQASRRQGPRPGQRRRRHHQLDQGRQRVRHHQDAEARRPADVHHRHPQPRPARRRRACT